MRIGGLFAGILLPAILWATDLHAQLLRGSVRGDSSGAPVPNADIWLDGTTVRTKAGPLGSYRLATTGVGTFRLMVRAVGFRPLAIDAILAGPDTLDVDLVLTPMAVQLAPLEVTTAAPKNFSARMREFEERRSAGFGRFLDRDLLARYHGPVTTALGTIGGIRLVPLPCKAGYAVATGRGNVNLSNAPNFCRGPNGTYPMPPDCYLSVYVDGVLVWSYGNWGSEPPPNMDEIMALELQAVEVYRGSSELPIRYQGTNSACGAVLFWTREQ